MSDYAKMLRVTAKEIRSELILGWGNVCDDAADEIERLTAENEQLKSELRSMALDALATLEPIE